MEKQSVLTERDVIIEVLKLFRNSPQLWNPRHKMYTNKNARNEAYEILLRSWRKLEPNANIHDLKKKLSNWRTTYRRERRKVEEKMSSECDPDEVYKPMLWYYDYLTFMDEVCVVQKRDTSVERSELEVGELDETINDDSNVEEVTGLDFKTDIYEEECSAIQSSSEDETLYLQKPTKKARLSNKKKTRDHSVVIKHEKSRDMIVEPAQVFIQPDPANEMGSADLFGRSIASQLKGLPNFQRCLAEKLISEVMFYAKLDQLTIGTTINIESSDE